MRYHRVLDLLKEKKRLLAVALGVLGVLLLLLSEYTGASAKKKSDDGVSFDAASYVASQEQRLRDLVRQISGAGDAQVMITLETNGENVFAEDTESKDSSAEKDTQSSRQSKIAAASDGGLTVRRTEPEIRGVAVVCEGAGSDAVRREVAETVRAALGVSRDKIYVAQMQKNKIGGSK